MCVFVGPKCLCEVHEEGGRPCSSIQSKSGWDSSGGELWTLRILWSPFRHVCMSWTLWYSPNVKWVICVWRSIECPDGSGQ